MCVINQNSMIFRGGIHVIAALVFFVTSPISSAIERFVSLSGTNNPPYTNWADAATNIQWAVDVAVDDDVIWIATGVYHLTSQIAVTNAVTLRGANGYTNTIINGNHPDHTNRCVIISNNAAATLWGLTISNGYASESSGGGVFIDGPATVRECRIVNNCVYYPSDPGIAVNAGGGGVYMKQTAYLLDSTIQDNRTECGTAGSHRIFGGGIYLGGAGIVEDCRIFGNQGGTLAAPSIRGGGGIYVSGGGRVVGCEFSGNKDGRSGAGIYLHSAAGVISNCVFSDNKLPGAGMDCAVYLANGGKAYNCLIISNTAGVFLGGINTAILRNCTMAHNSGRGIFISNILDGFSRVDNNIIYYNSPDVDLSGGPAFTNFFANCSANAVLPDYGAMNITNPPLFLNTNAGNYRLQNKSPCFNAGINQDWMTNAVDLDGTARILYDRVDMGAYELYFPSATIVSVR